MGRVRVAAVQCSSRMGTKAAVDANVAKIEGLVRKAAAEGARFVVLPECAVTGYTSQAFLHIWHVPGRRLMPRFAGVNPQGIALPADSPVVLRLCALAGELGIYLTIPFVEAGAEGKYYNTVCLANPKGDLAVHYRKTHLWSFVDDSWCSCGSEPGLLDTEFGRVGLGICYDIHRLGQLYEGKDLWCLLYSVAWYGHPTEGPAERWFRRDLSETYLGKGALQCHVVAANWSTDREYSWDGMGYSSIYDPLGRRLAFLNEENGDRILYHDLPYGASLWKGRLCRRLKSLGLLLRRACLRAPPANPSRALCDDDDA
mmetsp:Transcript_40628/g.116243  ORF Transcript_40628/g.116243 Transcript_40628/m.116243 type:complete len:314 (-) Transcript_40628:43-984(-)